MSLVNLKLGRFIPLLMIIGDFLCSEQNELLIKLYEMSASFSAWQALMWLFLHRSGYLGKEASRS